MLCIVIQTGRFADKLFFLFHSWSCFFKVFTFTSRIFQIQLLYYMLYYEYKVMWKILNLISRSTHMIITSCLFINNENFLISCSYYLKRLYIKFDIFLISDVPHPLRRTSPSRRLEDTKLKINIAYLSSQPSSAII